ncbi:MAG: hypothetical protein CL472_09235 [Acidobacteria bacterium]|nr:hypothetical protein [Acidobacteriota bacterium]
MNPYGKHLLISNAKYNPSVGPQTKAILETFRSIPSDKWILDPQPDAAYSIVSWLDDGRLAVIYCSRVPRSDGLYKIVFLSTFPEGETQDADQHLDIEALGIEIDTKNLNTEFFPELFASLIVIDHEELDAIDIPQADPPRKAPYIRICADLIASVYTQLPRDLTDADLDTLSIWRHSETKRWHGETFGPNITAQPYDLSEIAQPLPSIYNLYGPSPDDQDPLAIRIQTSAPIDILSVKEIGIDPVSSMIAIQRIKRLIDTYAHS